MRVNRPELPEFTEALKQARIDPEKPQNLCKGRAAEFADYNHIPTEADAKALCADCPFVRTLCKQNARLVRPDWGIHAGVVWVNGRQHHWVEKLAARPEVEAPALEAA